MLARHNSPKETPRAVKPMRLHKDLHDEAFTRTPGISFNIIVMPMMVSVCFRASAGIVMPNMSPKVHRMSAIIVIDPVKVKQPKVRLVPFMA